MLLDLEKRRTFGELVFGIVSALGTGNEVVQRALSEALTLVKYETVPVHLIELLHEIDRWQDLPESPKEQRVAAHMDAGDEFRSLIGSNDALAVLGISEIVKTRRTKTGQKDTPLRSHAYVLRSLKHPDEVAALREIYGPAFILIGAYSPRDLRVKRLATDIAESHGERMRAEDYEGTAKDLADRDQHDRDRAHGQDVSNTFPLADFFVDCSNEENVTNELKRLVNIVFGELVTPRLDETAMYYAYAASLASAALGRQVGAALLQDRDVISLGMNEVPKFGGGQYCADDTPDNRDFRKEFDSSVVMSRMNLDEVLERLDKNGWFSEATHALSREGRIKGALPLVKGARIMQPMEFGRALHAEMAAILTAGRRGVSFEGATLFTTTFPCHECARHIVGAGIRRVVYIEPYAKSLASKLHEDEIALEERADNKVVFEPFVGVAPRLYAAAFSMAGDRKDANGKLLKWDSSKAKPRIVGAPFSYIQSEKESLALLGQRMDNAGIKPVSSGDDNA